MTRDIEDILKAMPLAEPTRALDERVMATLANEPPHALRMDAPQPAPPGTAPLLLRYPRLITWFAGAAAMAAAIALTITWSLYDPGTPTHSTGASAGTTPGVVQGSDAFAFDPVRIEHHWSSVEPRGVVMVDDHTPAAGYMQQSVRHIELVDDKNNVRMEFTVPRNDVLLIPVRYE